MRAVLPVRPWAEAKEAFHLRKQSQPFSSSRSTAASTATAVGKGQQKKGNFVLRTLFQIVKDPFECDLYLVSCSLSFSSWFFAAMNRGGGTPRTPSAYDSDDRNPTLSCL